VTEKELNLFEFAARIVAEPGTSATKTWGARWSMPHCDIEGDIPGEALGYSVHISVNWENLLERYDQAGFTPTDEDSYMTIIRFHRMNPQPGATNLASFKNAYKEFGGYLLAPAACKSDG
jgi:hypothetical protein